MKRFLGLALGLWLSFAAPALAVVPQTGLGDANYSVLNTDTTLVTTTALTAARTVTLPFAAGTCIGQTCTPTANQLAILDLAGGITYQNTLTITPQSGDTINGNTGSVTLVAAGARAYLTPTTGSNWALTTSGNFATSGACPGIGATATVTITIAAPGVISWAAHGMTGACPVVFTTSSALPTGITSGTTYWTVPSSIASGSFQIATTVANALAGTAITTSGSQAGTQTGTAGSTLSTGAAANITGLALTQGDWECRATVAHNLGASTSVTIASASIGQTSATIGTQGTNSMVNVSTAANVMGVAGQDLGMGPARQRLTSTTNVFLVAKDTFTVSTNVGYGVLSCRQVQ